MIKCVVDEEAYPEHAVVEGSYNRYDVGMNFFFPTNIYGMLLENPDPVPSDTGFIYTDTVTCLEDGRVMEEFHFGYLGEDEENPNFVVWGYAIFDYTGEGSEITNGADYYTGYQIVEDIFCVGSYEFCRAEGMAHMSAWPTYAD